MPHIKIAPTPEEHRIIRIAAASGGITMREYVLRSALERAKSLNVDLINAELAQEAQEAQESQ